MKKHRQPASRKTRRLKRATPRTGLASRRSGHVSWLPIDERILPQIFSFGRVKGIARIFLQVEIILSVIVVLGSLVLFVLQMVR